MKKIIIPILILSVLVIAGCQTQTPATDCSTCPKEIETNFQCQNGQIVESIDLCSEQKCPAIKCENVSIPYVEEQEYEYTFNFGIIEDKTQSDIEETPEGNLNYFTKQITKIKNFDNKAGTFKVVHHYRTLKKEELKESSVSIGSGETKEVVSSYDNAFGEDIEVKTTATAPTETRKREKIKYKQIENCNYSVD